MLDTQAAGRLRLTFDRENARMQDLRLIGVHEDGVHLLLADDEGNRYQLPLDESLRAAARRDRPKWAYRSTLAIHRQHRVEVHCR